MSLFVMPKKVSERIKKMQRNFLQGEGLLEKKPHFVRWVNTCKENRDGGGLGIIILPILNSATR